MLVNKLSDGLKSNNNNKSNFIDYYIFFYF